MPKFNSYEGENCTKPQRLVDKDGFVFPAPGGLHKDMNVFPDKLTAIKDDADQEEQNEFREDNDFMDLKVSSNSEGLGSDSFVNPIDKPSQKGAALQEVNSRGTMKELMSNFIQETSHFQSAWSNIFSQSEEFEFNCLEKLGAYTEKAKKLDKDLERQKNALCHRIKGKDQKRSSLVILARLSKTLQEKEKMLVCVGGCSGSSRKSASCWYTLWYIWFVLGLFVIVITVLVVLYIKHRTKERSRHRRRRRSTRTVPIHIAAPTGPPGYAEPSHKPPSYEEAMRNPPIQTFQPVQIVPGTIIPNSNEDYGYQPPPTSMRMVPNQPLPPSYAACTQGQGYGHPT